MVDFNIPARRIYWTWIELAALLTGIAGTATACLANYNWHWFKESIFFMIWSVLPYGLFFFGSRIARRLVKSHILPPVTGLLAIVMTALSLMAYIDAVRHPNHSSGMVFAILPVCWMIGIPLVLTILVLGFLAADRR